MPTRYGCTLTRICLGFRTPIRIDFSSWLFNVTVPAAPISKCRVLTPATFEWWLADIAGKIHRILADNGVGKSRVVLDPEDVARLHTIAGRLGAAADVLTPNNPIG
jgi:hypothetical protein